MWAPVEPMSVPAITKIAPELVISAKEMDSSIDSIEILPVVVMRPLNVLNLKLVESKDATSIVPSAVIAPAVLASKMRS